jgi:hypothetical protein
MSIYHDAPSAPLTIMASVQVVLTGCLKREKGTSNQRRGGNEMESDWPLALAMAPGLVVSFTEVTGKGPEIESDRVYVEG